LQPVDSKPQIIVAVQQVEDRTVHTDDKVSAKIELTAHSHVDRLEWREAVTALHDDVDWALKEEIEIRPKRPHIRFATAEICVNRLMQQGCSVVDIFRCRVPAKCRKIGVEPIGSLVSWRLCGSSSGTLQVKVFQTYLILEGWLAKLYLGNSHD